eukprot:g20611.t1
MSFLQKLNADRAKTQRRSESRNNAIKPLLHQGSAIRRSLWKLTLSIPGMAARSNRCSRNLAGKRHGPAGSELEERLIALRLWSV